MVFESTFVFQADDQPVPSLPMDKGPGVKTDNQHRIQVVDQVGDIPEIIKYLVLDKILKDHREEHH